MGSAHDQYMVCEWCGAARASLRHHTVRLATRLGGLVVYQSSTDENAAHEPIIAIESVQFTSLPSLTLPRAGRSGFALCVCCIVKRWAVARWGEIGSRASQSTEIVFHLES